MSDYPDPTPEMLNGDPLFDAIWNAIKGWDISRHNDGMYTEPSGNDARHIYDAVKPCIEALEAALRFYACHGHWMLNGQCDPNSSRFAMDKEQCEWLF